HSQDLFTADRRAAWRQLRAVVIRAVKTAPARADPGGDAVFIQPEPGDRRVAQTDDDRPAMPVVAKEAARAAGPDPLGLHRSPRRQRDDVPRRAGRLIARLGCFTAGLVDDPPPGLVGGRDPG